MTAVLTPERQRPVLTSFEPPAALVGSGVLDAIAALSSAVVVVAAFGFSLPGQRWAALVFVLLAPGWALIRSGRGGMSGASVFVAVGLSIAVVMGAGHLAVTVVGGGWEPIGAALAAASLFGIGRGRNGPGATAARRWRLRDVPIRLRASLVVGTVATAVALVALTRASEADIGRYGLIEAFPPLALLSLGVIIAAAVFSIGDRPWNGAYAAILITMVAVVLHGAPGVIEAEPRFPVAWLHVGFIDHIAEQTTLLTNLDARFSWPAWFAGGGLLQNLAGTDDLRWLIRFAPVVHELLAALGVASLGRVVGLAPRAAQTGALLYVVLNWSGQDYLSPQAVGQLLFLATIVLVLDQHPGTGPQGLLARLARWTPEPWAAPTDRRHNPGRRENAGRVTVREERRALAGAPRLGLMALVLFCGVQVIGHQLSPPMLTLALVGLAVLGLTSLRWLGVIVGVMTVAWLAYGAEAFWFGHLDTLFGDVGNVSSIVADNVTDRSAGALPSREWLLRIRLLLPLGVWAVTGALLLGIWRRRPLRHELTLGALFVAPFPLLILQPYGGELAIRIFLFTLPAAALLLADRITTARDEPWSDTRRSLLWVALVAVLPLVMLARFGNEQYERVDGGDVIVAEALYAAAPDGGTVVVANRQALIDIDRVGDFRYVSASGNAEGILEAVDRVGGDRPVYVYLSRPQARFGEHARSRPEGWLDEVGRELATQDGVIVHLSFPGWVLEFPR